MRYLRFIILVFLFIIIIIISYFSSKTEGEKSNNQLENNVFIEGVIINIKKSNNHAFGIIELKLTKCNVKKFMNTDNGDIFPYKVKDNVAELYCTISIDRKVGDLVRIISNKNTIYYNYQDSNEEGSLFMISDGFNKKFVKENTIFK